MNCDNHAWQIDTGPDPYTADIEEMALKNQNFRLALWTGCYLQMTLMSIPPYGEVGLENHEDTDQLIRIEQGRAAVKMGSCNVRPDFQQILCKGDAVFVPAGTWHNIVNIGRSELKLSSVYAPPHHPKGTVHCTRADAEKSGY